jgi:cell division inhibitor SulA
MTDTTLTDAMNAVDSKSQAPVPPEARKFFRRPTVQQELSAQERQEITVRKFLTDGFYKAKTWLTDSSMDITDVMILDQLNDIAKLLSNRALERVQK